MPQNNRKTRLEVFTDYATIVSSFGIVIAIVQMCSQNNQFNDSFELSNNQFQYQLKKDSSQSRDDSVKNYRDSIKLQLAINEFRENKERLQNEANRSESQFQKNLQTLEQLVKANKESNEYVVNSQRPLLELTLSNFVLRNNTDTIDYRFGFKNHGIRVANITQLTPIFIEWNFNNFDQKIFSSKSDTFTKSYAYGNKDNGSYDFYDTKFVKWLSEKNRKIKRFFFILDVNYEDELTSQKLHNRFYIYVPNIGIQDFVECNPKEKKIIDSFIESRKKEIFKIQYTK